MLLSIVIGIHVVARCMFSFGLVPVTRDAFCAGTSNNIESRILVFFLRSLSWMQVDFCSLFHLKSFLACNIYSGSLIGIFLLRRESTISGSIHFM